LLYLIGRDTDWVIHSKLSYTSDGGGFVKIWRNNVLLLSAADLLTSYNQQSVPYMKVGSYVESWKKASDTSSLGINWASIQYKALILGNEGSSYDQVGTPRLN
jgi:hypothetical protein